MQWPQFILSEAKDLVQSRQILRRCAPQDKVAAPAVVSKTYKRIYAEVRRIPRGRVATYGQIAERAGLEGHARQVGYALHALPSGSGVPWHRVVNARGEISARSGSDWGELQRLLLEEEGIRFDERGRIDMERYGWKVRGSRFEGRGKR